MPIFKRTLSEFLYRRFVRRHFSNDLLLDLKLEAKRDTLAYLKEHMANAHFFEKHQELVHHAVSQVDKSGMFLEFGVARGKSIRWIASQTERTVHGFDSFEGIPEYWAGNPAGTFARRKLPKVPDNVELHIGLFADTLPDFVQQNSDSIAFLHVDCDLYSSTRTVFDFLGGRLQPGAIILFDDYYNYPGWRDNEHKAFQEFVAESGMQYEYIAYSVTSEQVAAQVLANPSFSASQSNQK